MTPREFNSLNSLNEQSALISYAGKYLDERILNRKYKIEVHSLYDFYVEVWRGINNREVKKIVASEDELDWISYQQSLRGLTVF